MTTTGEQALAATKDTPLHALATQINAAHDEALASVRTALGHACRAGDLLLEAKRQLGHGAWGPWVRQHCTVTKRTAQKFMQLARELPTLTSKAPRVADLSLREAIHLVSVTGRIAGLDPEIRDQVLQRVEQGQKPKLAIRAVTLQRIQEQVSTPPPDLMPSPQTDQRCRRVERDEEQRLWTVIMGPNAAGLRLPEIREKAEGQPQVVALLADADVAVREAVALEVQAKKLHRNAAGLLADARAEFRRTITNKHGPIYPVSEAVTYKCDEALHEHLKTLTESDIIDLLAQHGELVRFQAGGPNLLAMCPLWPATSPRPYKRTPGPLFDGRPAELTEET